ncbi:MAG TPA: arginase [Fimbriimonadaceae bacterium]|nr:arginase [Fimbriimonadaceae bacterium]
MVDILAAPFDGGGARRGSRLGPSALELAGLREALVERGLGVSSWRKLPNPEPIPVRDGLRSFDACLSAVTELRAAVATSLADGRMPLVVGGEHSISMGGISAALNHTSGNLAVLWIDAHADANVPGGSPSGSLHGMPLGALLGLPSGSGGEVDRQWSRLVEAVAGSKPLEPSRLGWIGLRDVDPGERELIQTHPEMLAVSMHEIDRWGLVAAIDRFDAWMRASGAKHLWISFDVDVLDPILAPGTGTAVRGGLSYREGHLIAELLREKLDGGPYRLLGLDVVEVNPLEDVANSTAKIVVEWIASLFGKTILGSSVK